MRETRSPKSVERVVGDHDPLRLAMCVGFVIHRHSGNMHVQHQTSLYEENHLAQAVSNLRLGAPSGSCR